MDDLARIDAHLGVRCPACGHSAIYERRGVTTWFHHKGWNPSLEAAGRHFRCRECGHRGAELRVAPRTAAGAPDKPEPLPPA